MKSHSQLILKSLLLVVLIFNFIPTIHAVSYKKSWSFERDDAFKIEIDPQYSTFQPGKNYTFTIILSPMNFALNQTKFSNISVQLAYLVSGSTITCPKVGTYEFDSLGGSITNYTTLSIPNAKALGISKQSDGSLEYLLNYNIVYNYGNISYVSTNWQRISITSLVVSNAPDNTYLIVFAVIVALVVLVSAFRFRRKNTENSQPKDSEVPNEEIPKKNI